jgi:hypothetical protein
MIFSFPKMKFMKRSMRFAIAACALFITAISSCDKKTAQDLVNSYVNSLSATVTNASTSGSASFTASSTNATKNGSQLTIDGNNGNQRITIAINNWAGNTGTYSIGTTGNPNIAAYNTGASGAADIIGTSGNIIVTNVDNTSYTNGSVITASFNFTAGSYSISSGSFKVFVHS